MAAELQLHTNDGRWRVDLEAWTYDSHLYRSIGAHVTVYHRERTTSIWGGPQSDWEEEPAELIRIRNVYRGAGPGTVTREQEWRNESRAELKQWAAGGSIGLPANGASSEERAAVFDIDGVEGTVTVVIGQETLMGVVSAGRVAREQAAPLAA